MKADKPAFCIIVVCFIFITASGNFRTDKGPKEKKSILGNWIVESWKTGVKSLEWLEKYGKGAKVVITANQIEIKGEERTVSVSYRLISDGKITAIDFIEEKERITPAIYKLEDGKLTICVADSPDKKRPTEFKAKPGPDGQWMIILNRNQK